MDQQGRPTLVDVAREAGVSLATVDRVVNRRPNVSQRAASRVREAMERLDFRPDPLAAGLARRSRYRFCFVLPSGTNAFMSDLAAQVRGLENWLAGQRAMVDLLRVDVFDAKALAATLDRLDRGYKGVAVVALDDPLVGAAIDRLVADGTAVVTLVSDVPASRRSHYVGIDNSAAGRTAGTLMGRFLGGRQGSVGIIVGALSLRDHMERCFGFSQALDGFGGLRLLPVREMRDDRALAEDTVAGLLREHPGMIGLYNTGAGNQGVAAALESAGRTDIVFVGHEITDASRSRLRTGTFDAFIAQNPGHEARSAARILLALASGQPIMAEQERIRIDIFLKENLP